MPFLSSYCSLSSFEILKGIHLPRLVTNTNHQVGPWTYNKGFVPTAKSLNGLDTPLVSLSIA